MASKKFDAISKNDIEWNF